MNTREEILNIYDRNVDTVYRVCYAFMKNVPEAEDMTQETFLRLMSKGMVFQNLRHEKAWLIVTASNLCKDSLKKWWRRTESLEEAAGAAAEAPDDGVLEAVLSLPPEYKAAVYLYYYEGYSTGEIAKMEGCPESTLRNRLSRARRLLHTKLGGGSK